MSFRCLFHVHTRHSYDSLLSPEAILRSARKARIDVLIVTDHNTLAGAGEVRTVADGNPRFVVSAAEYKSEKGDIIGLFIDEEIRSSRSGEIIEQVHSQGGIVVLPHPFKAHRLDDDLLAGVDLVEIYNSRCSAAENASAAELARRIERPYICGADAHCGPELLAAFNEFECAFPENQEALREALLFAPRRMQTRKVSPVFGPYSQMIKAAKTGNPWLFVRQAKKLAVTVAQTCFQ